MLLTKIKQILQFPFIVDSIFLEGSLEVKLPTMWTDEEGPAARQSFPIHLARHVLCCKETQHFVHPPLTFKICFVRDFPQKVKVEDLTTKL